MKSNKHHLFWLFPLQMVPLCALAGGLYFAKLYVENELGYHGFDYATFPGKGQLSPFFFLFYLTLILTFILNIVFTKTARQYLAVSVPHACLYCIAPFIFTIIQGSEASVVQHGLSFLFYILAVFPFINLFAGYLIAFFVKLILFSNRKQKTFY